MSAFNLFTRIREPSASRRLWLKAGNRSVSFGDLVDSIEAIGGLVAAHGLARGDRVLLAVNDDADMSILLVGLICHGVTTVQIDPATHSQRASAIRQRVAPALTIIDRPLAEAWDFDTASKVIVLKRDVLRPSGLTALLGAKPALSGLSLALKDQTRQAPPRDLDPETLAYIMFTSGTTSDSKGVCVSHRALFAHLTTLIRIYGLGAESRILNTLMLSHADGLVQGPLLSSFATAAFHRPFHFEIGAIERYLDAVYQLRITHMVAVPTMLSLMVRLGRARSDTFQGGDFRLMISCGAALEPALWEQVQALFGVEVINLYGLTETVTGGVVAGGEYGAGQRGAIGVPVDCELRIVDDSGADVAPGDSGELLMRGDLLMTAYFDNPVATAEAMQDGWFHTGDIARRDTKGDYWICGRKKSIIVRGGFNIHPEEIVEALTAHPRVREAVAFGEPDTDWGEIVIALAVADDGVSETDLMTWVRERLEPRKVPERILLVDALPRGRSGKVVLPEARALAADRQLAAPQAVGTGKRDVDAELIRVAGTVFVLETGTLTLASAPQTVSGWDSLAHLNLVFAVESEFGIKLSPAEIMAIDSLAKMAELIRAR